MIKIVNAEKIYSKKVGISDVNLTFPSTGLSIIFGESGSGKSTLINCLSGLDSFSSGELFLDGNKIDSLKGYSSFVFQEFQLFDHLSVNDNLSLVLQFQKRNDFEAIDKVLSQLNISDIKHNPVNKISGGQKQRVAIARALLSDKPILIADEPTANLDEDNSREIAAIFKAISSTKLVIVVTHDFAFFEDKYDQKILVSKGRIAAVDKRDPTEETKIEFIPKKTVFAFKNVFAFARAFAKKEKKLAITTVIMTLCFSVLSLCLNILMMDVSNELYRIYKHENQPYVQFVMRDEVYKTEKSITSTLLNQYQDVIKTYDETYLFLNDQDGNLNPTFEHIWVTDDPFPFILFGSGTLNNGDIIITSDVASQYFENVEDMLGYHFTMGTNTLTVSGIFEDSLGLEKTCGMNESTYQTIKHNNDARADVNLTILGVSDMHVLEKVEDGASLYYGRYPAANNEIVIGGSFASKLADANGCEVTDLLEQTYDVLISQEREYYQYEETYPLKIVGISAFRVIAFGDFYTELFDKFCQYSLDYALKGIGYFDYTKDDFKLANENNLHDKSTISEKTATAIDFLQSISMPLLYLSIILILVSGFSLLSNIINSTVQRKKEIGILASLGVEQKSIIQIFMLESVLFCVIAALISSVMSFSFLVGINELLKATLSIAFTTISYNFFIPFLVLGLSLVVSLLFTIYPIIKLFRKKTIDIIYER